MKKLNEKLESIANNVGVAAHSDPQKQNRPVGAGLLSAQNKGITLIALIITIIVMLILVGVTVNVALNGGLFGKDKKATYQTEASMIKEQLEIAKAVETANNGGKLLDNYSIITVDSLDIDKNIINKYKDKILVNAKGDILYDTGTVTGEEGTWLQEVGINPNIIEERVPFTNYIENGEHNYYINGDSTSDSYYVAFFSSATNKFTIYNISNGTILAPDPPDGWSFEVIDKNETPYTEEQILAAIAPEISTFDEVGDDIMLWGMGEDVGLNVFNEKYTKVIIGNDWFTLDTSYTLPTT